MTDCHRQNVPIKEEIFHFGQKKYPTIEIVFSNYRIAIPESPSSSCMFNKNINNFLILNKKGRCSIGYKNARIFWTELSSNLT